MVKNNRVKNVTEENPLTSTTAGRSTKIKLNFTRDAQTDASPP